MSLPNFIQKEQIIMIVDHADKTLNGAWKIYGTKENPGREEAPLLLLESIYRTNKAYATKAFNPKTMRSIQTTDVTYQDSFLPLGTKIFIQDAESSIKNGFWQVNNIVSGNTLDNAVICFKKDTLPLTYMSGKFNAITMKIIETVTPTMAVVTPSAFKSACP